MKKYEYKIITSNAQVAGRIDILNSLNALGADGFHVIDVQRNDMTTGFLLEREIEE